MAKFNETKTIKTVNNCGHVAYSMTDKAKLVTQVLTSFFNENKFYGDNSVEIEETIKKVIKKDPKFVSNLAVYARRKFNMRSITHVLTAYLAHETEGKPYVRETVKGISLRGDDITETMAFYLSKFGKPIPNSLKKGINDVLVKFDEYTLAKYKGNGKTVKMRDLLCLCRPTPLSELQSQMWKRCLEDKLEMPVTWETQLSANGNNAETWEKLIDSGKVGYMALLRNLANIIKASPKNIDKVLERIQNPEAVRKSKQLPFRYLSAYRTIQPIAGSKALDALESAVDIAVENIPKIHGNTVIAVDVSASMHDKISSKSEIRCCEIALMLAYIANRICDNAYIYAFDTGLYKITVSKRVNIIDATLNTRISGGGTDMSLPFQHMISDKIKADRVIIMSDNMCNSGVTWYNHKTVNTLANEYRAKTGNNIWVHAVDLQGYGTQQFAGERTNIIAGWSERVFDFINLAEQGENTLEKAIENYTW